LIYEGKNTLIHRSGLSRNNFNDVIGKKIYSNSGIQIKQRYEIRMISLISWWKTNRKSYYY